MELPLRMVFTLVLTSVRFEDGTNAFQLGLTANSNWAKVRVSKVCKNLENRPFKREDNGLRSWLQPWT